MVVVNSNSQMGGTEPQRNMKTDGQNLKDKATILKQAVSRCKILRLLNIITLFQIKSVSRCKYGNYYNIIIIVPQVDSFPRRKKLGLKKMQEALHVKFEKFYPLFTFGRKTFVSICHFC